MKKVVSMKKVDQAVKRVAILCYWNGLVENLTDV